MNVGKRLKYLRLEKKLTLKELAEKSGVAIATLSRIEHDIMTGTLESHASICKALEINLADFYRHIEDNAKDVSVLKKTDEKESLMRHKEATIELLTTKIMSKKMLPALIRIKKGEHTQKEENKPSTEKFIYVLEGSVNAKVLKDDHFLTKGDSLYFDASLSHTFINTHTGESVIMMVMTPPEL